MKKQKFEVKRTTEGTVFEVAFLLLAVVTWVIVVMLVNDAPDTIPTHFGLSGTPNSYGSKYELYFPCILTTVMGACCLAGAYFPHTVNIPGVPISNNRQAALAVRLLRVMGLYFAAVIPGLDRWSKRFFRWFFIVYILCCVSSLLEIIPTVLPVSNALTYSLLIVESLFLSLPLPMLTVYLLHCSGEDMRASRLFRAVLGLWAVYFLLVVSTPFVGGFADLTPNHQLYRGPLYPVLLLPMVAVLLLNFVGVMQRRSRLSRKVFFSFLVAIVPTTVALIAQMIADVFPLLDISYVASALSMYSLILSDQIEQDRRRQREIARQQQEIANQRASIMVLQMRPHFIYNTMTSIYCLCGQDPQLARQVVLDFTTYLRKNFSAIASDTLIPFSSELEHTRAYLAVEQATYADSLFVDYDTPHTWFRVPPLTLQPIVENAVKHGRDPYAGPFHISIRTRKTDDGSEISVADDGRGFDPADGSEQGLALNNIRQRLENMCGGSLTITPNDGGGTVVTLTVPDGAAE